MKYSLLSDLNDKDIPLIHSVYKTPKEYELLEYEFLNKDIRKENSI